MSKVIDKNDFYENLDSTYFEKIQKLENEILMLNNNEDVKEKVLTFSENFLLPKYLWSHFCNYKDCSHELFCRTFYHFSDEYIYQTERNAFSTWRCKLLHLCTFLSSHKHESDAAEFYLSYPNWVLDYAFDKYAVESNVPVPKGIVATYQKMKTLYNEIIAVQDDDVQWFHALTKSNDLDFVEENVEFRLGENLTNKKLWKMYLEYLKTQDSDKLLQTYSKYCRFFLDDIEIKEEYRKTAEKFNYPVKVPWKNPLKFEIYDSKCLLKIMHWKFMHPDLKKVFKQKSSNTVSQNFPFKRRFIKYILHNSNGNTRQKLFFSCKYFFDKLPTPICYKLKPEQRKTEFSGESLHILMNGLDLFKNPNDFLVKNLFITTFLNCHTYRGDNRNLLSLLIPRIHQCTARFVNINSQILTMKELKFLIGHGNVEELSMLNSKIISENGDIVFLEDILGLNLKLRSFTTADASFNPDTVRRIVDLKFENKFDLLVFFEVDNLLEPHGFAKFLKKNISIHSEISVTFKKNVPEKERFCEIVKDAVNQHWKNSKKPSLTIF